MEGKEQIAECYRIMYQGMIAKDRALMERVLDENFILVHMTGMRQNREEYISAIEQGVLNYYSAEHENIQTTLHGDSGILVGQSLVNAAVFGGGRHTWRLQLESQIVKRDGRWYINETTASTY